MNPALPYRPELVRFKPKAKYHSPTRGGYVEFENVLEVYVKANFDLPGAQPTHVVIFECKDHGRNVEVGKVDEVVGRLNSSFGFSIKAYIVTRKGFAASAVRTAKSNGIGLIKIMPEDQVRYLAYYSTSDTIERSLREFPKRVSMALTNPNYISDGEDFYAVDDGYVFSSLRSVIESHFQELDVATRENRLTDVI